MKTKNNQRLKILEILGPFVTGIAFYIFIGATVEEVTSSSFVAESTKITFLGNLLDWIIMGLIGTVIMIICMLPIIWLCKLYKKSFKNKEPLEI